MEVLMVKLEDAKKYLRIDYSDEDALLQSEISAEERLVADVLRKECLPFFRNICKVEVPEFSTFFTIYSLNVLPLILIQRECSLVEGRRIVETSTIYKSLLLLESLQYSHCWATPVQSGGSEKQEAGTTNSTEALDFTVRYAECLEGLDSTKLRIRHGDDLYNVTAIDPMGFHHRSLKFRCEKVKR